MTCVVLFYIDYGVSQYGPLIERMAASARAVMPGVKLALMSDRQIPAVKHFDTFIELTTRVEKDKLCRDRARAMVSWMRAATEPVIFADPDIEFIRPPVFHPEADVQLLWRSKPDQPVNTGLILAKPGPIKFWERYGTIAVNLPQQVHHWWGDQLAFALITGTCNQADDIITRDDARIWLMDAKTYAPLSKETPGPRAIIRHFKGRTGKAESSAGKCLQACA